MIRSSFDVLMAVIGVIVLGLIIYILTHAYFVSYPGRGYYSVQSVQTVQPYQQQVQINPQGYYTTR